MVPGHRFVFLFVTVLISHTAQGVAIPHQSNVVAGAASNNRLEDLAVSPSRASTASNVQANPTANAHLKSSTPGGDWGSSPSQLLAGSQLPDTIPTAIPANGQNSVPSNVPVGVVSAPTQLPDNSKSGSSTSPKSQLPIVGADNGLVAAGTTCREYPEGEVNCVCGNSYQRCANGQWSAIQLVSPGTKCLAGISPNIEITVLDATGYGTQRPGCATAQSGSTVVPPADQLPSNAIPASSHSTGSSDAQSPPAVPSTGSDPNQRNQSAANLIATSVPSSPVQSQSFSSTQVTSAGNGIQSSSVSLPTGTPSDANEAIRGGGSYLSSDSDSTNGSDPSSETDSMKGSYPNDSLSDGNLSDPPDPSSGFDSNIPSDFDGNDGSAISSSEFSSQSNASATQLLSDPTDSSPSSSGPTVISDDDDSESSPTHNPASASAEPTSSVVLNPDSQFAFAASKISDSSSSPIQILGSDFYSYDDPDDDPDDFSGNDSDDDSVSSPAQSSYTQSGSPPSPTSTGNPTPTQSANSSPTRIANIDDDLRLASSQTSASGILAPSATGHNSSSSPSPSSTRGDVIGSSPTSNSEGHSSSPMQSSGNSSSAPTSTGHSSSSSPSQSSTPNNEIGSLPTTSSEGHSISPTQTSTNNSSEPAFTGNGSSSSASQTFSPDNNNASLATSSGNSSSSPQPTSSSSLSGTTTASESFPRSTGDPVSTNAPSSAPPRPSSSPVSGPGASNSSSDPPSVAKVIHVGPYTTIGQIVLPTNNASSPPHFKSTANPPALSAAPRVSSALMAIVIAGVFALVWL